MPEAQGARSPMESCHTNILVYYILKWLKKEEERRWKQEYKVAKGFKVLGNLINSGLILRAAQNLGIWFHIP